MRFDDDFNQPRSSRLTVPRVVMDVDVNRNGRHNTYRPQISQFDLDYTFYDSIDMADDAHKTKLCNFTLRETRGWSYALNY